MDRVPEAARQLMDAFWPGPLTLLLPRTRAVPDAVTAGRPLVGVRMPSHPVALELIRRAGVPVAAPSANRFGHISPTTAAHVLHDLDGRIDAVLDAGPDTARCRVDGARSLPSPMMIYRPGAITAEQIREIAGPVSTTMAKPLRETPAEALPSPGVGLRHYAPTARLVLIEAQNAELGARLAEAARAERGERRWRHRNRPWQSGARRGCGGPGRGPFPAGCSPSSTRGISGREMTSSRGSSPTRFSLYVRLGDGQTGADQPQIFLGAFGFPRGRRRYRLKFRPDADRAPASAGCPPG